MMSTIAKGSAWRLLVQRWAESHGWPVTVRGIGFAGDDIRIDAGGPMLSVECKNVVSMKGLSGWVDQAAANCPAGWIPVVVAKRRGRAAAEDGYAIMRLGDFGRLCETTPGGR